MGIVNSQQAHSSGGGVLVVEDIPASLKLLSDLLTRAGFVVRAAPNGELALWTARAQAPELVLLDVRMPGIDGYEVCRQLKLEPALRDVPVIFLSAHSDPDDKLKGFEAGGVDYISKPYQFEEVNARVTAHLKIVRLQKTLEYQNENLHRLVELKAGELVETRFRLRCETDLRDFAEREARQRLAEIAHMNRNANASACCASMVHELSQPRAAIMSNVEAAALLIDRQPPPLADVAAILADIRHDELRTGEVIARMRNWLKKSAPRTEQVDLNELIGNVMVLMNSEAQARACTLDAPAGGAPLPVEADRIQIQQALINLVMNAMDAVRALPEARRRVRLLADQTDQGQTRVRVVDNGCGFGAHAERVFESFFTTKSDGMGLGLSITAAIVKSHGGAIWAGDNDGDEGATVGFTLPRRQLEA